ncbi:MAG: hypothetical protein P8N02_17670 [Actinomycetota bacterium]|jgi:hypothetical protein|nr:hypothetical protein [Actinomycetota bacterium]
MLFHRHVARPPDAAFEAVRYATPNYPLTFTEDDCQLVGEVIAEVVA